MSRTLSPCSKKPYGVARVTELWGLARSSFYAARHRKRHPREEQKRGPKVLSDAELVTASPDMPIDQAVRLMRQHAVRRLPVVQAGRAVGVVSIGDFAIERDENSALADISAAKGNT